ncbi:hypothetical protein [Erythrobacter sp. THAF29]|uniref:hypothetical protein n=1 Tax=Erythrobacter sp. THAF29 TaxID=2587851 RepID=UPI001268B51C|nr:hypothetical protein [Erythrobacter sp. THAF29]QFT76419.1 hypothetical protein FIU90_02570 [Erythrobacter sp. THAF29]
MILSALLLSLQAAPEPVPEIVVLGNLRSVQVVVGQDPEGRWHCSMNKSTGRPKLDDRFCRAVTKCVRKGASDREAVESCIRKTRSGLVRKFEREMKKN